MLGRIPLHIAVQIERQVPNVKVNPCQEVKPDRETFVQDFINKKPDENFFAKNIEENDFEKILLALLKNSIINPYNVNQNILLAKEYASQMK